MGRIGRIGMVVALLAAACAAPPRDPDQFLHVENRGGPDLVLAVGPLPGIRIPCGTTRVLRPGEGGLPDLPWRLEVRRARGGEVVLVEPVTSLPQWLVQLGSDPPGLSSQVVLGPAIDCPATP